MWARVFYVGEEVKMFFLYFKNVEMKEKEPKEYYLQLMSHLEGLGLYFFFEKFNAESERKTG